MFHRAYPLAWLFHQNTSYGPYPLGAPTPSPCEETLFKEYLDAPLTALPPPGDLALALGAALRARQSCRAFAPRALALADLSTLLQAAYGVVATLPVGDSELLTRPVPSGGGLYPLDLYL